MFFTPLLAGGVILTNAEPVSLDETAVTSSTTETANVFSDVTVSDTTPTTAAETSTLLAAASAADTNSTATSETPALVAVGSRADTNSTATSETVSRVTTSSVSETASTTTAAPTPITESWAGSGTINGKTPTSGGGTWIASPEMVYSGGYASPNASFNSFAFHSVVRTDAEITAVIYPGGVGPNLSVPYRLYGRADTTLYPGSFYVVEFNDVNAQYNIRLFSNTGDLASTVTGISSYGKTATLRINGSSIKVILDGVTIFDVTDTSVTGPGYFGFQIVYNEYGEEAGESTSGPISITPLAVSSVEATATLIASASRADTNSTSTTETPVLVAVGSRADTNSTASLETPVLVAGAVSNDTNSTSTSEEADVFSSTLENVTDTNSVSDSAVTANNIFTGTPSDTTATNTSEQSNVQYVVAISDTTSTADTAVSANNILVAARLETAVSTATTETNTVVAGAILSETAVSASSENSTAIFSASRAETNSSSTSESAGFLASAAVNETNTTASSESSILTAGAAVSASVSTATNETVTANLSVTATDTTSTSTSDIGGLVIPVSISDTNSSSDSATVTQSLSVSFNETTTTSSSESSNVVFITAISEQAQANDSITAGVVSLRAVTDSNGIVTAQSSFIDAGAFLSDSIASSTIEAVLVSFLVNYTETTTTSSNDFGGIDLSNIDIYDYIIGTDGTDSTILYKPTTGVKLVVEEDALRKLLANEPLSNKIKTTVIGDYPARRLSATTPQKKYIKVN